ncbi:MAG: hypothetical protein FWE05_02665 [Defluviitaleaceae bacterium]|nr:hypothetical protein [Defluviitaleaceae bacterium]
MNGFNKFDGESIMHFLSSFPKERRPKLAVLAYCFYVSFSAFFASAVLHGIEFFYPSFLWVLHFFWAIPLIFWFWGMYLYFRLTKYKEISMKMYYIFSTSSFGVMFIPVLILCILGVTEFRNIYLTIFFLVTCTMIPYFLLKIAKKLIYNRILDVIAEKEKRKEKTKSTTRWDISIALFITIVPRWLVDNFVPDSVGFGFVTGILLIIYSIFLFFAILPCIMLYLLGKHKLTFLKVRC